MIYLGFEFFKAIKFMCSIQTSLQADKSNKWHLAKEKEIERKFRINKHGCLYFTLNGL